MNKFVISSVAALALVAGAGSANGQTVAELQALIASLQSQIAALAGTTTTTTVASSYVNPGVTLRVGSKGVAVTALQNALNNLGFNAGKADGVFGNGTAAAVRAFQASKGLGADGVAGNQTHGALTVALSGTTTTPTTPGNTTTGQAGDLSIVGSDEDTETTIAEGTEEKVYSLTVEAEDSDIEITNVKVEIQALPGANNGSTRIDKYFDEVIVYLGDKEIGSVDADELSKSGTVYSKSIVLKAGVVKEDAEEILSVALKALSSVDEEDTEFDVAITNVRYVDGTGAIMTLVDNNTGNGNSIDNGIEYVAALNGFDAEGVDDKLSLDESDNNPDASNFKVDEDSKSDSFLVLAAEVEADEDGNDIDLLFGQVTVTADSNGAVSGADINAKIIDKLTVKVGSTTYTAKYASGNSTEAVYDVDFKSGFTVDAGDTEDIEISAIFKKMDGNYTSGTTVGFEFEITEAEGVDEITGSDLGGPVDSEEHTLVITEADISASVTSEKLDGDTTGAIHFTVEVEAGSDPFIFNENTIVLSKNGSPLAWNNTSVTFTSLDSNATESSNVWTVKKNKTAKFALDITLAGAGTHRVELKSIAGVSIELLSGAVTLK